MEMKGISTGILDCQRDRKGGYIAPEMQMRSLETESFFLSTSSVIDVAKVSVMKYEEEEDYVISF